MNPPELSILKFANDCTISMKQIKIRSFNLFHRCQMTCVRDLKNQQSEQCFKSCENGFFKFNEYFVIYVLFLDLDEFYKFKRLNKVENSSYVFYHLAPPAFEPSSNSNLSLTSDQARE